MSEPDPRREREDDLPRGAGAAQRPSDRAGLPGRGLRRRRGAAGTRSRACLRAHDQRRRASSSHRRPDRPGRSIHRTRPAARAPGTVIGPYKLLEQIGEGGMGVVYMAEQTEPVRRKVALKIIKPGMDTRQVIARFEAERQALALMDHPNIAKVLDAGTTEPGRPYFVMELVKGIPITEYCDRAPPDAAERLELFVPVCQAVQHAHQKGIIHRDLKPSNVLVTLHDGNAGAQGHRLRRGQGDRAAADRARRCSPASAQIVGTPMYMSPEQAELKRPGHRHPQRHLQRWACCSTSC